MLRQSKTTTSPHGHTEVAQTLFPWPWRPTPMTVETRVGGFDNSKDAPAVSPKVAITVQYLGRLVLFCRILRLVSYIGMRPVSPLFSHQTLRRVTNEWQRMKRKEFASMASWAFDMGGGIGMLFMGSFELNFRFRRKGRDGMPACKEWAGQQTLWCVWIEWLFARSDTFIITTTLLSRHNSDGDAPQYSLISYLVATIITMRPPHRSVAG